MPIVGLHCADLSAALDTDLGAGLLGLWRSVEGLRTPIAPPAPYPDTSPAELLAAWPEDPIARAVPVRIVHRTPLSIAWAWPDGATARWELTPDALLARWQGLSGVQLASRLPESLEHHTTGSTFALSLPRSP